MAKRRSDPVHCWLVWRKADEAARDYLYVATREIRDSIELLATLIRGTNEEDKGTARSKAILIYCALVGAIGVARAVSDQQLSPEILKTVAQLLKNPLRQATSATSER